MAICAVVITLEEGAGAGKLTLPPELSALVEIPEADVSSADVSSADVSSADVSSADALQGQALQPWLTLGEAQGARLPAVMEAESKAEFRHRWDALQAIDGVVHLDLIRVDYDADEAALDPRVSQTPE